jgi:hypothetical protein
MPFVVNFIAFVASSVVLGFISAYVIIPGVACFPIFLFMTLISKKTKSFIACTIYSFLLVIEGSFLYGIRIYSQIRFYPSYGNVLAIVLTALSLIVFFGSSIHLTFTFLSEGLSK